jgi:hypothetical protein
MFHKDNTSSTVHTSSSQIPSSTQQYGQQLTEGSFGNLQYYSNIENFQSSGNTRLGSEQRSVREIPDMSSSYWCPNCFKQYSTKYTLLRHIKFECGKEPQFPCGQCFKRFKHKSHLVRHMRVCKVCLVNKWINCMRLEVFLTVCIHCGIFWLLHFVEAVKITIL